MGINPLTHLQHHQQYFFHAQLLNHNNIRINVQKNKFVGITHLINTITTQGETGFISENTYGSVLQGRMDMKPPAQVHAHMIKCGFRADVFFGTKLVTMYTNCGRIENARQLFDEMPERDVISWTAMITGYASHGLNQQALHYSTKCEERLVVSQIPSPSRVFSRHVLASIAWNGEGEFMRTL